MREQRPHRGFDDALSRYVRKTQMDLITRLSSWAYAALITGLGLTTTVLNDSFHWLISVVCLIVLLFSFSWILRQGRSEKTSKRLIRELEQSLITDHRLRPDDEGLISSFAARIGLYNIQSSSLSLPSDPMTELMADRCETLMPLASPRSLNSRRDSILLCLLLTLILGPAILKATVTSWGNSSSMSFSVLFSMETQSDTSEVTKKEAGSKDKLDEAHQKKGEIRSVVEETNDLEKRISSEGSVEENISTQSAKSSHREISENPLDAKPLELSKKGEDPAALSRGVIQVGGRSAKNQIIGRAHQRTESLPLSTKPRHGENRSKGRDSVAAKDLIAEKLDHLTQLYGLERTIEMNRISPELRRVALRFTHISTADKR